jgi:hypothetical protein
MIEINSCPNNQGDFTMIAVREPILHTVPIADLRPTQITVGMREVEAKQKSWQQQEENKKAEFLGRHMIPVIRGPKDRLYVLDHHHLSLALHNEGVEEVLVSALVDLRMLSKDEFWVYLDNRAWVHPYDASGRRRDFADIPKKIGGLKDDPFRSIAGELRRGGGHHAVQRVPVGRFHAPPYRAVGRGGKFRQGSQAGPEARPKRGGELPAGLVRAARGSSPQSRRMSGRNRTTSIFRVECWRSGPARNLCPKHDAVFRLQSGGSAISIGAIGRAVALG